MNNNNLNLKLEYIEDRLDSMGTFAHRLQCRISALNFSLCVSFILHTALFLAVLFLAIFKADAQTIGIDLVLVRNPHATTAKQLSVVKASFRRTEEMGVRHFIGSTKVIRDVCRTNKLTDFYARTLNCWSNYLYKKNICKKEQRCNLIHPPFVDERGNNYGAGVAMGICTYKDTYDFNLSVVREKNAIGLPRVGASITTVTHENGHNNGAEHDGPTDKRIMNTNAGMYGNERLKWSEISRFLIDGCMWSNDLRKKSKYFGDRQTPIAELFHK